MDNAEHTLFACARRGVTREVVDQAVGAQLSPDTIVSLMLQSEQIWMLIESFGTLVMKKRARWACGTRRQRGPVEIASGSVSMILHVGRTWLPASFGGEIFLFLSLLARLVGLPNERVAADGSPGRMDDGRDVHLLSFNIV